MNRPVVLVVDDEAGMRHAIQRVLEPHCTLTVCETAGEARVRIGAIAPELVFLDIRLPDGDGFELMQHVQETMPRTDVVLMTGSLHDMDRKLVRSLRERAFFFLAKPFGRELLLTVFDRWRELRDLTRSDREHRARLESDLREAQAFQLGLLPAPHGRFGDIELWGHFQPCEAVSGDLYDYAPDGNGHVALFVCDVSGHGVPAAMLSGFLKSAFHAAHADGFEPLAVVHRVFDAVVRSNTERFVTLFAARIRGDRLDYANAGHTDGLLVDAGVVQRLGTTGPMVSSAFPAGSWRQATIPFPRGARLLLHTDGVEETRGDGGLFGIDRLESAVGSATDGPGVLEHILGEVRRHAGGRPPDDDLSLLLAIRAP